MARKLKIINKTPHAITVVVVELPAPRAEDVARVEERAIKTSDGFEVPIVRQEWGSITGLPDEMDPDIFYVVSRVVAAAACCSARGGMDLLVPAKLKRDGEGRVIGCGALAWASTSLPGLEDV